MIRVPWDIEEYVALIDIYHRCNEKSEEQIETELIKLSKMLNLRAQKLEINHDEKFRNLNGMKIMFQNVVYIATDGRQGMSSVSNSMRKVYDMSIISPEIFNSILEEFKSKYCTE